MDDSFNLARHVARFVSLIKRRPDAQDAQKLELRTLALLTKEGTVRLGLRAGQLVANGLAVPAVLDGVADLADQMTGHKVEAIEITQGMAPAEMLAVARILASPIAESVADVHQRLRALDSKTVLVALPDPAEVEAPATPAVPEPPVGSAERVPFVLERALRGGDGNPLAPHFEEVAFAIEQSARVGDVVGAVTVFTQLIDHEVRATDPEVRRHFVLAVRRLSKPAVLHPIARRVLAGDDDASRAIAILVRCGNDGADAVIDQYARATTAAERNAFAGALDTLPAADDALFGMLMDVRPNMARIAAELIGERLPAEGDTALADHIAGADPRVRRAVVRALGRYDTPFAVDAIARALDDAVVEVRLEAVAALARRGGAKVGDIIGRALDAEEESEVQMNLAMALGRVATPGAVARLIKAADAGGLFASRRAPIVRAAAVRALAATGNPEALEAVAALVGDKEREVREAAVRAAAGRATR